MQKNKIRLSHVFSVAAILVAFSAVTTAVYAALKMSSDAVENSFIAESQPSLTIDEDVTEDSEQDGYILKKEDVTVTNDADYSVYIRAAVVVTWQNDNGEIYTTVPTASDYDITYNDIDWTQSADGYWYYNSVLESNGTTEYLIESCEPKNISPIDGYTLHVNIIAQSIQSAGTTDSGNVPAIMDAWNHSVSSN